MGLHGEVLQSTSSPSRRILIDLPLKPPVDEVRYSPACGGTAYAPGRHLVWKTRGNELELIDHVPASSRELGLSLIVQFPRHVQVAPHVSIKHFNGRIQLIIASQASFHLIELLQLAGAPSILSDLTASSFKRTCFIFPIPLPITQCSGLITGDNRACLAISAKNQKCQVYTLTIGSTQPVITELSTSSMLGRFLWSSGSASSQPRAMRAIEHDDGLVLIVALCQDEMVRIWTRDGALKLECEFNRADQRNQDEPLFGLEISENDVYIQIGNCIHHGQLELDPMALSIGGSVAIGANYTLVDFVVVSATIWAACKDEESGEVCVKNATINQNRPVFVDCAPSRPPPELMPPNADAAIFLLQADLILPLALRRALEQVVTDLPEAVTSSTIGQIIEAESQAAQMSPEAYASELYQIVLQYHYEAIKFNGFARTDGATPMVVRAKCCSLLRPLTELEQICSGASLDETALNLPSAAQNLLSRGVVTLNRLLYESEVLEAFEDQVNTGVEPLQAACSLVDEIDRLVSETATEADKLAISFDDEHFALVIGAIITHLETSPITRQTVDQVGKVEHVGIDEVDAQRWSGAVVRSIIANMSKLAQLLLILTVWSKGKDKMADIKERLARVVSDFMVMEWVCVSRGARKVAKTDDFMSSISSTIMSQSQSTLIGDSFVSMSHTALSGPSLTQTEEPLLELWLAQSGQNQAKGLCPLGEAFTQAEQSHAIQQLISPQNRLLTIPVYLLETNQIELLTQWVKLNSSSELHETIKSSLAYLNGVCHLHHGKIDAALVSFQDATANLHEDFFLTHVLSDESEEDDLRLKTSFYLAVIGMFKGHPNQQVKLAHYAVHEANPADERLSMLWTMVFKLNLELENYPDAYTAMTSNMDDDRRKDCLRNFVLHLSERGDLAPLVEAPYGGLEDEIGSILENRALAVSAQDTRYFDLLFAFHITKENFRQAARAMYLHATQLANENDGIKSIMLREAALLASINCLNLAEPDNQWIAIGDNSIAHMSPKRDVEGDFRLNGAAGGTTTVIGLGQIENDLRLVQVRFILAESGVETFAMKPSEVATLLCQADYYDEAADLLLAFGLSLEAPIVHLAKKYACAIGRPGAGEIECQLAQMIESRELRPTSTTLYRAACEEILKFGHQAPEDLLAQFKQRDMNDVLRLMAKYGEIESAVDVAIEILGQARNHKQLTCDNIGLIVDVPVLLIEQLNYFLKTSKHEQHEQLEAAMASYLDYLEKTATIAPMPLTVGYYTTTAR